MKIQALAFREMRNASKKKKVEKALPGLRGHDRSRSIVK